MSLGSCDQQAEKSHSLQAGNLGHDVIWPQSEQNAWSQILRAGEDELRCSSSGKETGRRKNKGLFYSNQASVGWTTFSHLEKGNLY